jgi:hypothetical protein
MQLINCRNYECKHYYEETCLRLGIINLNENGVCISFEEGRSEAYLIESEIERSEMNNKKGD